MKRYPQVLFYIFLVISSFTTWSQEEGIPDYYGTPQDSILIVTGQIEEEDIQAWPEEVDSNPDLPKRRTAVSSIPQKEFHIDTKPLDTSLTKEALKELLKDHQAIAQIDSLWQQELYHSPLFDTVYNDVRNLTYEPVEFKELPTAVLKERLKELNAKTPFNIAYNPSLESVIKSYLKNRHEHLERLLALSKFYFPLFEETLDKYNLPLEIKYLAIVESALKPRARSRVGATGLWQFMYGTGKMFGLDVTSYVDDRMDPIKATEAACKYLAQLYKVFGDWDLALASYNSGPGNVTKAIRRSGGYRNYWNIRPYLPRETAGYVPAFLATMYIFEYADQHDIKSQRSEFTYYETDTLRVKETIKLDQVADLMNMDIAELKFLNPAFKLDIIPHVKKEGYVLRLPVEKIGPFVTHENNIYAYVKKELNKGEKPLPQLTQMDNKVRYRVRSGDNLGKIAGRYGVRVSQLKRWNGLRSNNIRIGQRLTIYTRKPATRSKSRVASAKAKASISNQKLYTVRSGDTLWSISQRSGVSIQNLKSWNGIRGTSLKPGMKLKVSKI